MRAPSFLIAYGCMHCHDSYDRRKKPPQGWTHDDVKIAFYEGVFRTQIILEKKGLLKC